LALAAKQWRKRPRGDQEPEIPKWMTGLDHFNATRSFGVGVALSALNPKNLVLAIAAATSIEQIGMSKADVVEAIIIFVVLASVTVVGPVLFLLVAPRAAEKPLASLKEFMIKNSSAILIVLFIVLGAKLIGDGIGGF